MNLAFRAHIVKPAENRKVSPEAEALHEFVPPEVLPLENPQTDIPRIAKDERLLRLIEEAVRGIPTVHDLYLGDARQMDSLPPENMVEGAYIANRRPS